MLDLTTPLPEITKYKRMKILGSGKSITKYSIDDIEDDSTFYVLLNHVDVIQGLDRLHRSLVLFFAHDYQGQRFDSIVAKNNFKSFLMRDNVHVFLHAKDINHHNCHTDIVYPEERLGWIKNLHFYEKAQSNISYFENSTNSLLGFSSTLHSPLSLAIGNHFITEVYLYGLDLYIYQTVSRFDNLTVGSHASIIFNANKQLLNYLNLKRPDLKIAFFN